MKKAKKFIEKNSKIIVLSIIFLSMLLLNSLTPLLADDYSYALGIDNQIVKSISDIIIKQANHYMVWGGRSVAHFTAQFFLMFPKIIFNIFNSIIYTIFINLIYKHIKTSKEEKPIFLLLIHFALYFLLPVFGENCIWLIGSCNYLWTTTIILAFLLFYKDKDEKKKESIFKIVGMFFLGIIAGWTNENTAVGLIAITFLLMMINKNNKNVSKYRLSGFIGVIIGFIIMIAAPGNYIRTKGFNDNTFILLKLVKRIINCTNGLIEYVLPLIIIAIILISYYLYKKKKINIKVYIFLIGAFLTDYSMALSPEFPKRSWFGIIIFMIIAIGILIYDIEKINNVFKYIVTDVVVIASIIFINDYIVLATDINITRNIWKERIQLIEKGKNKGIKDFEFYPYYSYNKKAPNYELVDIGENEHSWPNNAIEYYYNINSIKTKK